jgi:hypothetical protein
VATDKAPQTLIQQALTQPKAAQPKARVQGQNGQVQQVAADAQVRAPSTRGKKFTIFD